MYIVDSESVWVCIVHDYPSSMISDDVTEVYPMSRIVQEASSQKDLYGQGNLQETYYAVSCLYSMICSSTAIICKLYM